MKSKLLFALAIALSSSVFTMSFNDANAGSIHKNGIFHACKKIGAAYDSCMRENCYPISVHGDLDTCMNENCGDEVEAYENSECGKMDWGFPELPPR